MTAKIFEYKKNIGIDIDMKGKFINDPFQPGQLGCVISTKDVIITPSAIDVIKNAKREGGSFAELMLTKHDPGPGSSIGILGGGKINLGSEFSIGRDCETSILDDCVIEDFEVPEEYKNIIDK